MLYIPMKNCHDVVFRCFTRWSQVTLFRCPYRWSRTRCAPSATWRMERSCCRSCGTSTRRRPADPRRLAGIGIKNLEKFMGKPWKNQENHVGNAEYYGNGWDIWWYILREYWWSGWLVVLIWFSVANTICESIRYMLKVWTYEDTVNSQMFISPRGIKARMHQVLETGGFTRDQTQSPTVKICRLSFALPLAACLRNLIGCQCQTHPSYRATAGKTSSSQLSSCMGRLDVSSQLQY